MSPLRLWLNDQEWSLDGVSPTTTLLRFVRDTAGLTGTKEGCAEGDCGACTVAVLDPDAKDGPTYRAVNACLLLVPMLHNRRVYTVEALRAPDGGSYHPAQEVLAYKQGSQCGYCTPGVVMSLFEACYRQDMDEPWKLDAQMCGNLCRCTGYRPIRDAARELAGLRPEDRFAQRLREAEKASSAVEHATATQRFSAPGSLEELWAFWETNPEARLVAGATDLGLDVTKRYVEFPALLSLEALPELRALTEDERGFSFGATVTLTELEDFSRARLPPLERMLRYFGARQIKNRATLGGNLCNASPIGDLAPVLLALGAQAVLLSQAGERRVPLEEFFVGYRKTALLPHELLARVELPRPDGNTRASAYKVSKRRELDISTVAAAFAVTVDEDNQIRAARLAFGGMAATPARARFAEASLLGKPWTDASLERAAEALEQDFQPLTDHRGSAAYRSRVAQNLLRGFFEETARSVMPRLPHPHTGTVQVPERP